MKIKNWSKFQHFKNRCPPWIKLHREILDRRDINVISDRSFRVLINLWLLASEDKGKSGNVPNVQDIAFRTRLPEKYIIEAIQELGEFIEYDSEDIDINAISERYQLGPPEGEGEGETEKKVPCTKPNGSLRANGIDFERFWKHWPVKINKKTAKAAFMRKKFEPDDVEQLISDITKRIKFDSKWKQGFIPHCSTYLNGDRWEDDYGN